ncbi:hypothetical protein EXIGLDRAFT_840110 [Exidia glandulosa HHB12029]|uniref:Concanavalin A-like lectin/glucanase n=1 Tax=Exidia glandulosa HHB12029 TaxID=1314781 RepID=A0A165ELW2_EXIGL|nr:hypothetical protein EXIGLDRAFT_840110 [Exidia glandulosa HHB12029]
MRFFLLLSLSLCASLARSKLLVNYTGGQPATVLGVVELEGQDLGDRLSILDAGDEAYIQPVLDDKTNMSALRFHRDSHYRRAEVRSLYGDVEANKTYYIGYTLRVPKMRDHLVIFQWKKQDKLAAPRQNIPFHLFFSGPDQLSLEYTTPGSNGSNRTTYWTGNFSTGHDASFIHTIGMAINTCLDGRGSLELFLDGKPAVRLDGAQLFTGATYPKFGIYRAEADAEKDVDADEYAVDSFVYRVQISDGGWADVAEAAGLSDDVVALLEATEPRSASKWSTTL